LNGIAFNAEPQQTAVARGELINGWGADEPQHMPNHFRGLRRRWLLRPPTVKLTCDYLPPLSIVPLEHSGWARCSRLRSWLRLLGRYTRADALPTASSQHSV